jgi:hypothetical protein
VQIDETRGYHARFYVDDACFGLDFKGTDCHDSTACYSDIGRSRWRPSAVDKRPPLYDKVSMNGLLRRAISRAE